MSTETLCSSMRFESLCFVMQFKLLCIHMRFNVYAHLCDSRICWCMRHICITWTYVYICMLMQSYDLCMHVYASCYARLCKTAMHTYFSCIYVHICISILGEKVVCIREKSGVIPHQHHLPPIYREMYRFDILVQAAAQYYVYRTQILASYPYGM